MRLPTRSVPAPPRPVFRSVFVLGLLLLFLPIVAFAQQAITAIGVVAVIVVQAFLIAGLLFERSKRWRATRQLAESEQQFSKAFKANSLLPIFNHSNIRRGLPGSFCKLKEVLCGNDGE